MRLILTLTLLAFSSTVWAGESYYLPGIDTYDPVTGLYYRAVEKVSEQSGFLISKTSRRVVLNINIFDPSTEKSTLLFQDPQNEGIALLLFETGFKDGSIQFNGSASSRLILNNERVGERAPRDRLLIGIRRDDAKETVLFVSDKRGGALRKLVGVPFSADWHIDIRNSKLRVVHQTGAGLRLEAYDW